ncbi:hypothetical protein [Streptomyces sp. NBC_01530]|uniref:hypothetical protein n=1 Tax=Streptomyces sp. NBC_01530 TaxID=2903895 RepID=UPI003868FE39
MHDTDTRWRTTHDTEDTVVSTAYTRLLEHFRTPTDYWDRPAGDWGPPPAREGDDATRAARADANSAYRLATKALRRGELPAARAAFTLALAEQHPGAAFRIVLTGPRRPATSAWVLANGGGKTLAFTWVIGQLMAAARWGHADAQRLVDGIRTRPPRSLHHILAQAQHAEPSAAEALWSSLTFTCPPHPYEPEDSEFYPAVRDTLVQLLAEPAPAREEDARGRARAAITAAPPRAALTASRPRLALPPGTGRGAFDALGSFDRPVEHRTAPHQDVPDTLAAWMDGSTTGGLRLLTGTASSGKSRLTAALACALQQDRMNGPSLAQPPSIPSIRPWSPDLPQPPKTTSPPTARDTTEELARAFTLTHMLLVIDELAVGPDTEAATLRLAHPARSHSAPAYQVLIATDCASERAAMEYLTCPTADLGTAPARACTAGHSPAAHPVLHAAEDARGDLWASYTDPAIPTAAPAGRGTHEPWHADAVCAVACMESGSRLIAIVGTSTDTDAVRLWDMTHERPLSAGHTDIQELLRSQGARQEVLAVLAVCDGREDAGPQELTEHHRAAFLRRYTASATAAGRLEDDTTAAVADGEEQDTPAADRRHTTTLSPGQAAPTSRSPVGLLIVDPGLEFLARGRRH